MIARESLVAGYKVLLSALNVKTLYLSVPGNHLVVGMKIINIVVGLAVICGGLTGRTPSERIE